MARWQITVAGKGVRKASVENLAEKLKYQFGEGVSIVVRDATLPESRSDRYSHAMSLVSDAKSEVEEIQDELQEWLDGMPENLQQGSKASEIQDAIDACEEAASAMDELESNHPIFPAMY